MKFGKKELRMLYVLGIIVVIAVMVLAVFYPMMTKTTELKSELTTMQAEQGKRANELGENNANLTTAKDALAKALADKEKQEDFFMPYNDRIFELTEYVIRNILVCEEEGMEYDFQGADYTIDKPNKVEDSEVLWKLEFTLTITQDNVKGSTLGDYYKLKNNVNNSEKLQSVMIESEQIKYIVNADDPTNKEASYIEGVTSHIVIYMIQPLVEEEA